MKCDKMRNELWDGSANASLNIIFLCSVEFFWVDLELLTWGFGLLRYIFSIFLSHFGSCYLYKKLIIG